MEEEEEEEEEEDALDEVAGSIGAPPSPTQCGARRARCHSAWR